MTITLPPGATVVFAGDSITDADRSVGEQPLGSGYPLHVAGQWGLRRPDRPVTWINAGVAGDGVGDLEARWQADVLDARPHVVTVLVGINDVARHSVDAAGHAFHVGDFAAGYERLLAPLTAAGVGTILVEPFLLPVDAVIEVGDAWIGPEERLCWRTDVDRAVCVVRELAVTHGAHLLAADAMFAELAVRTRPEHWAADGVHPTPAGHAALAAAWLRLVA